MYDPEETYGDLAKHGFGQGSILDVSFCLDRLQLKLIIIYKKAFFFSWD